MSRIQSIIANLTGSARHVYAVVPADKAVSPAYVFVALRDAGHRIKFTKVQGCLNDLAAQRLL